MPHEDKIPPDRKYKGRGWFSAVLEGAAAHAVAAAAVVVAIGGSMIAAAHGRIGAAAKAFSEEFARNHHLHQHVKEIYGGERGALYLGQAESHVAHTVTMVREAASEIINPLHASLSGKSGPTQVEDAIGKIRTRVTEKITALGKKPADTDVLSKQAEDLINQIQREVRHIPDHDLTKLDSMIDMLDGRRQLEKRVQGTLSALPAAAIVGGAYGAWTNSEEVRMNRERYGKIIDHEQKQGERITKLEALLAEKENGTSQPPQKNR